MQKYFCLSKYIILELRIRRIVMNSEILGKYIVLFEGDKVGSLNVYQKGLMIELECQCVCASAVVLRLAVLTGNSRKVLGVMMPEGDKLKFKKKYSKSDLKQLAIESIDGCYLITDQEAEQPFDITKIPAEINPAPKMQPEPLSEAEPTPIPDLEPELAPEPLPTPELEPEAAPEPLPTPELEPEAAPEPLPTPELEPEAKQKNEFLFKEWVIEEDPQSLFGDEELIKSSQGVTGTLKKSLNNGNIMLAVPFAANEPFPLMQIFCFGESMSIRGKNYLVFQIKNGKLVC